jgi:hypothetical protein
MPFFTRKFWLGVVVLLCLASASFADNGGNGGGNNGGGNNGGGNNCNNNGQREKCQVPEGGTAVVYLLGAGAVCLGAIAIRSRAAQRLQS